MSRHYRVSPPIAVPCGPHGSLLVACSVLISISVRFRAYCLALFPQAFIYPRAVSAVVCMLCRFKCTTRVHLFLTLTGLHGCQINAFCTSDGPFSATESHDFWDQQRPLALLNVKPGGRADFLLNYPACSSIRGIMPAFFSMLVEYQTCWVQLVCYRSVRQKSAVLCRIVYRANFTAGFRHWVCYRREQHWVAFKCLYDDSHTSLLICEVFFNRRMVSRFRRGCHGLHIDAEGWEDSVHFDKKDKLCLVSWPI